MIWLLLDEKIRCQGSKEKQDCGSNNGMECVLLNAFCICSTFAYRFAASLRRALPEIYLYFPPKISLIRSPKAPCRGKCGPTSERLSSLKGRKIIVFPDIDAFKDWQQKIFTFPHLDTRISRLLEDNATPADRAAHIYLADWILKYLETNNN